MAKASVTVCGGLFLAVTVTQPGFAQAPQQMPSAPTPSVALQSTALGERQTMERARNLLQTGGEAAAAEAYSLLAPMEIRWSRSSDFSYLLGVAALESGKPGEAIFALQRTVTAEPGFSGARFELARAYFEAGDIEDARREFTAVASQQAPPAVQSLTRQYLELIDRRALSYRAGWTTNAELTAGFDSNANAGTAETTFLGFDLNEASIEAESSYFGVNGQIGYSAPLTSSIAWRTGLEGRHREYSDAPFVSQTAGRIRAGLLMARTNWQLGVDASGEQLALDGQDNRQVSDIELFGHLSLSAATNAIASLRTAQVRFDDDVNIQDVDQVLGALLLQWRPRSARRWQFLAGPLGGSEDAYRSGSPFSRDLIGARIEISRAVGTWTWKATMGGLKSDYEGRFFGASRSDSQLSFQLYVEIPEILGRWSLRPSLFFVDNQSDISLYEYARVEAGLTFKRSW